MDRLREEQEEEAEQNAYREELVAAADEEADEDATVTTMDKHRAADFRELFNVFDANGDGVITLDEIGIVMSMLGHSCTHVRTPQSYILRGRHMHACLSSAF